MSSEMKFHFCQNDCFKCTCVLNVISNMTELIHFALGKLFAWKFHAGLKFHFGQNDQYDIHTGLSFILPHFIWTKVKELAKHWSEIFNHNKISYQFEFISALMWMYSSRENKTLLNLTPCVCFFKIFLKEIIYIFNGI